MTKLGIPTIFWHHSLLFARSCLDLKSSITCGQNASVGSQGAISHREKNWNQKFLACKSDLWKSFLWAFKGWRCFLGGWIEQAAIWSWQNKHKKRNRTDRTVAMSKKKWAPGTYKTSKSKISQACGEQKTVDATSWVPGKNSIPGSRWVPCCQKSTMSWWRRVKYQVTCGESW